MPVSISAADRLAECRNVLVRYCAHIPRNYQYRDGIRLVCFSPTAYYTSAERSLGVSGVEGPSWR